MRSSERVGEGDIPRWSKPWAAGWSAMSDVSRIEIDGQRFGQSSRPRSSRAKRQVRAIGLAAGVLAAVCVAATTWL